MDCAGCYETIREPNEPWYAGTRYLPENYWVCSQCVRSLPVEERHPITDMLDFEISFGPVEAETNGRGRYQMSGSRQLPVQFTVAAGSLSRMGEAGENILQQLYPFYCFENYMPMLADSIRDGSYFEKMDRLNLQKSLTYMARP